MKKRILIFLIAMCPVAIIGQTILLDEDFSNGIPANWTIFDQDQLTPDSTVSHVTSGWIGFETATDTCAVSTSFYDVDNNQVSLSQDYLITPQLNLLSFGHLLTWESKSFDANYPEDYLVLLSTTDSLPESFTDTLKIVNNDSPYWKSFSYNLFSDDYADQPVYVAFRNRSTNAFLLGIDNVKLTTNDPAYLSEPSKLNVSVYPNPVNTKLYVDVTEKTWYRLFNSVGELIASGMLDNNGIDFNTYNSGVYIINLFSDNGSVSKKIVKHD